MYVVVMDDIIFVIIRNVWWREKNGDIGEERITFLYKFSAGPCPKSYSFNAAKLAGLPCSIISFAQKKAKQFEESTLRQKLFRCDLFKLLNFD